MRTIARNYCHEEEGKVLVVNRPAVVHRKLERQGFAQLVTVLGQHGSPLLHRSAKIVAQNFHESYRANNSTRPRPMTI